MMNPEITTTAQAPQADLNRIDWNTVITNGQSPTAIILATTLLIAVLLHSLTHLLHTLKN